MSSTEPTRVTMAELAEVWARPDAVGLTIDYAEGLKVVRLVDGTTYAAPLEGEAGRG